LSAWVIVTFSNPQSVTANPQLTKAERIGIEPTSVPVRGTDNGFEDREDHQAPFTLLQEENAQRPTSNIQLSELSVERWALKNFSGQGPIARARPPAEEEEAAALFCFLECRDNGVEIRPIAGVEFGME
jgi:hypothetical protein